MINASFHYASPIAEISYPGTDLRHLWFRSPKGNVFDPLNGVVVYRRGGVWEAVAPDRDLRLKSQHPAWDDAVQAVANALHGQVMIDGWRPAGLATWERDALGTLRARVAGMDLAVGRTYAGVYFASYGLGEVVSAQELMPAFIGGEIKWDPETGAAPLAFPIEDAAKIAALTAVRNGGPVLSSWPLPFTARDADAYRRR